MACVHSLQHVQRLAAPTLADYNSVGAHAQGVAHQVTDRNRASAVYIRNLRFQTQNMVLLELQLSRVFNGHNTFSLWDKTGENVEKRGLTGARPSRNDNVKVGEYA